MLVFGDGLQMSPTTTYECSVDSLGGNGERKVNETRTIVSGSRRVDLDGDDPGLGALGRDVQHGIFAGGE